MPPVAPVSAHLSAPGIAVATRANQSSALRALCVVCGRSMPLTSAGVIRVHGPLSNRCNGSGMPPSSTGATDSSTQPARSSSNGASQVPPISQSTPLLSLSESLSPLFRASSRARVLKRIPRASRHLAATKLAGILDEVTEKNDVASWDRLFRFGSRCLTLPRSLEGRASAESCSRSQHAIAG